MLPAAPSLADRRRLRGDRRHGDRSQRHGVASARGRRCGGAARPRRLLRRRPQRSRPLRRRSTSSWSAPATRPARPSSISPARARSVTMIVRGDQLGSKMSAYLVERIEPQPARRRPVAHERHGGARRRRPARCGDDLRRSRQEPNSCGRAPCSCASAAPRGPAWAAGAGVRVNSAGFVLTGSGLLEDGRRPEGWPLDRDPLVLETTIPGLFAAGDLRSGSTKRVAGAVGEGAMAAALVHRRLEELAAGR